MGYLRQDLADPLYAVSDADAAAASAADAPWLFEDSVDVTAGERVLEEGGGIDWKLSTCCNTDTIIFICLTAGYLVIIYFLWNTMIMKPMKLIAVFVHGEIVFQK